MTHVDASASEYENSQDLQAMLEKRYEFLESLSDQSENEDSILDERGKNYEVESLEENGSEKDENEEDVSEVESQEEISDEGVENKNMENYEVKKQENGKYEGVKKLSDSDKDEIEKGKAVVHQIGKRGIAYTVFRFSICHGENLAGSLGLL